MVPANNSSGGALRYIANISKFKEAVLYVGPMFPFFWLHWKHYNLPSLSYIYSETCMVCYVILPTSQSEFEEFPQQNVYNVSYLTLLKAGARLELKI